MPACTHCVVCSLQAARQAELPTVCEWHAHWPWQNESCVCWQVTHQLQYLPRADQVLVLDHGRIVAQGSHAQLVAQGINFHHFEAQSGADLAWCCCALQRQLSAEFHSMPSWWPRASTCTTLRPSRVSPKFGARAGRSISCPRQPDAWHAAAFSVCMGHGVKC